MKCVRQLPFSCGWTVALPSVCGCVSFFVDLVPACSLSMCPLVDAMDFLGYLHTFPWFRPIHALEKSFFIALVHVDFSGM